MSRLGRAIEVSCSACMQNLQRGSDLLNSSATVWQQCAPSILVGHSEDHSRRARCRNVAQGSSKGDFRSLSRRFSDADITVVAKRWEMPQPPCSMVHGCGDGGPAHLYQTIFTSIGGRVLQAVRNFVQLCLEGYYDGCLVHRVIKDMMVQTGDPTGTGRGGESIYGHPFKDEFHSRLRFNHRF